jgi:hypothetical protein
MVLGRKRCGADALYTGKQNGQTNLKNFARHVGLHPFRGERLFILSKIGELNGKQKSEVVEEIRSGVI